MKKALSLFLVFVMLLSLWACDQNNNQSDVEGNATEHSSQNTEEGVPEDFTHLFGTETGYAMTLSYDKTTLNCYQISTSELLYDCCTTELPAEGWYKFREHNGITYYSPAPCWALYSIDSYTISDRIVQLKIGSETIEMELISKNQYKVTKGVEDIPAGIVFTFGTDLCSCTGHLYERSCENDVACMNCQQIKGPGLGHEYGADGVCFRCFAAMLPEA